jgi:hypothetical protein
MPSFAESWSGDAGKARAPMNNDIVKPMPASKLTPWIAFHEVPEGSTAADAHTASHEAFMIPIGFPSRSPSMTPRLTGFATAAPAALPIRRFASCPRAEPSCAMTGAV